MTDAAPGPAGADRPGAAGSARARALVGALREAGGPAIEAVVLFGSQLVQADPDAHSAWDLVVIVDDYAAFHRRLVEAGHHRRPAWLLSVLARVLPPNITAFDAGDETPLAKCAIVSRDHFVRALAPGAPDHFLKGRMVQKVAVVWSRSDEVHQEVERALQRARDGVIRWVAPRLADEGVFGPDRFASCMLEVSYGGEVRPESGDRVRQVFEAQRTYLVDLYGRVLARAAERGEVEAVAPGGGGREATGSAAEEHNGGALGARAYRLVETPGPGRRLALRFYFMRSKARATLRWLKHVVTFNDWLTYVQRKVERRIGRQVTITPWERRLPLLLLWPKAIRILRYRRTSFTADADAGPEPGSTNPGEPVDRSNDPSNDPSKRERA